MDTKIWLLLTVVTIVRSKGLSEISDEFGTNTQKLFDENKKANPAIWRQVDNITITGKEGAKINKIIVTDLREEKDGEAKIVEGGIGQQNVTIELKSPTALRGYDFHIEVYADSYGQASTTHEDSKLETDPRKSSEEKKDEPSSTTKQPLEGLIIGGERQIRDAEDKQFDPHSLTDVTTKVPESKSTGIPTIKDNKEDSITLNKGSETSIAHIPIHLQEAPKMPESTARSVLTTELKIAEENHNHHEIHDNFGNKKHTNFDSNEKQPNINNSQFIIREVTPNVPVNVNLPAEGHKIKTRDVTQNTPVVAVTEHTLPPVSFGDQGSTKTKVPTVQTKQPEIKALPTENKENVTIDNVGEKTNEHHHHNNRYNRRYVPDRFARKNSEPIEASTETKVSTITSTAQSTAETITGKKVNTDIPELHITNKDASEETTAKRAKRDAPPNNKEPVLPTSNIKDSQTLKPEINGKSELDMNASKHNSDNKAPVVISEKHDTPETVQEESKDKQRNARGTEDMEKVTTSSPTAKPANNERNEEKTTDKTQVPIVLKSSNVKLEPKEKDRIARDVIGVPKSHSDEISSPIQTVMNGKKSDGKVAVDNKSFISTIKVDKDKETIAASNIENTKSEITSKHEENTTQVFGLKNQPGKFPRGIQKDIEVTHIEETEKSVSTSQFSKNGKVEPKQPEKSLVPPQ